MNEAAAASAEPTVSATASDASAAYSIHTLARFLLGRREAIEFTNRSEELFWIGLLFVLSAALAREYDGEYLLAQPWHLVVPLAASLASSAMLFFLIWIHLPPGELAHASVLKEYRSFLGLYWMTAPLAWVYAVPVERLFSAEQSVRANLLLLGIVAAWRVLLMIRILTVLYAPSVAAATVVVLAFADALMLAVLYFTPIPVIQIMGGVRLTEAESLLQATTFLLGLLGALALPILLIALLVFARRRWRLPPPRAGKPPRVAIGLWGLAVASLLIWIPILPFTQSEQSLRWRVESALRDGRVAQAIAIMSAHEQAKFPPHWDPPPRIAYANHRAGQMLEILDRLLASGAPPWVNSIYVDKLLRQWQGHEFHWHWLQADDEQAQLFVRVVERLSPEERRELLDSAVQFSDLERDSSRKRELTQRLRELKCQGPDSVP